MLTEENVQELHEAILYPVVRVRAGKSGGSGTIIYSRPHPEHEDEYESYVLTCWHVISDLITIEEDYFDPVLKKKREKETLSQAQVEVFSYAWVSHVDSGATYRADIVAYDKEHDLAVLKLDSPTEMPYVAELYPKGRERELKIFDPVWASGCSLGHDPLVNAGHLTYLEELIENKKYMMTSSSVIFGNSGGAIFLARTGQLIGVPARVTVTQMGFSIDVHEYMNFMVPIQRIYEFIDDQMLEFLYDDDMTSVECFERREKKQKESQEKKE